MTETEDATKLELYAMFLYRILYQVISLSCDLTIANQPLPLSRTTKAFPNHQITQQSGCIECYAEVGVSHTATPIVMSHTHYRHYQ